jgi:hypothetical protein
MSRGNKKFMNRLSTVGKRATLDNLWATWQTAFHAVNKARIGNIQDAFMPKTANATSHSIENHP